MKDLDKMLPEHMARPPAEPEWSDYQRAIFYTTENSRDNLAIEAVAGSGKSTTIIHAARLLPPGTDSLFLAFNKAIVKSLAGRLPYSTDCKTLNSLGHSLLMRKLKSGGASPKLNSYRLWDAVRTVLTDEQWEEYGRSVVRFVSLARSAAIGIDEPNEPQAFYRMLGDYDVDIPYEYEVTACKQASEILRRLINSVEDEFDFDDQLYMPVFWESTFPRYNVVFIDEAQDLSHIQHLMLERLAVRGARVIAVGDSRQAIYGFRGADTNSMANMAERFNMQLLPLSISYRCPKAVVREAQKIVYHIESADEAIEGAVEYAEETPLPKDFPGDCMVLCRTNAPIFTLALEFLKERRPCQVLSNFGKDMIRFVKGFDVKTTQELADALKVWRDKEKQKAEERQWFGKANAIEDRYEALIPFCEAFALKVQVVAALQQLLEVSAGPVLATIHKAKGMEAPTVFILRPDLLPAPFAKTDAAIQQERNLKYVAVTRAKEKLIFLPEEA